MRPIILFIFISFYNIVNAQIDTIIVFDLQSHQYTYIPQLISDTTNFEDYTSSFSGTLGNIQDLPTNESLNNLIPGTAFTNPFPAADSVEVNSFPARTAVKIRRYYSGTGIDSTLCGTLIGPNKVLTMLSFPFNVDLPLETDSILIIPINGISFTNPPSNFKVNKIIFRNTTPNTLNMLAILELDFPIGEELGWLGCGYSSSDSLILSQLYYKLSFPDSLYDYDFPSNGDTLMLNYGKMDYSNSSTGILRLDNGFLNSGMGGSSLFYKHENEYTIVGVSTFGSNYGHSTFIRSDFYIYKEILENAFLGIQQTNDSEIGIICYPNPTSDNIIIKTTGNLKLYQFRVFDVFGKLVYFTKAEPSFETIINTSSFNQGIYFIQVNTLIGENKTFKFSVIR